MTLLGKPYALVYVKGSVGRLDNREVKPSPLNDHTDNFFYHHTIHHKPRLLFIHRILKFSLVCVTEQLYVSIFFTRLWSLRNPLLFHTQNPGISGFSTAHAYKYKTKRQAKMKRKQQKKMTFLLISHQATLVLKKHRFVLRP